MGGGGERAAKLIARRLVKTFQNEVCRSDLGSPSLPDVEGCHCSPLSLPSTTPTSLRPATFATCPRPTLSVWRGRFRRRRFQRPAVEVVHEHDPRAGHIILPQFVVAAILDITPTFDSAVSFPPLIDDRLRREDTRDTVVMIRVLPGRGSSFPVARVLPPPPRFFIVSRPGNNDNSRVSVR